MVAIKTIRDSNRAINTLLKTPVALFVGATAGIGQSALKGFARNFAQPNVYIVARNAGAASPLLAELKQLNAAGTYTLIEKDVSLIKDANAVAQYVQSKEQRLDYLFLSAGFISFEGRHDTSEGLDPTMSTRFYSRARITQLLLPLLNASTSPHVVNVLAGGQEGALIESDLDLREPKNYSILNASVHSATMLTLILERFAKQNPHISFVHSFPGPVGTSLLTRGSSGIKRILLSYVVTPLAGLIAMSAEEAGERVLFYATSERFAADDTDATAGTVSLVSGLQKATRTTPEGSLFLVDAKSESSDNSSLLDDFRTRGVDEKVWEHTQAIFEACTSTSTA